MANAKSQDNKTKSAIDAILKDAGIDRSGIDLQTIFAMGEAIKSGGDIAIDGKGNITIDGFDPHHPMFGQAGQNPPDDKGADNGGEDCGLLCQGQKLLNGAFSSNVFSNAMSSATNALISSPMARYYLIIVGIILIILAVAALILKGGEKAANVVLESDTAKSAAKLAKFAI